MRPSLLRSSALLLAAGFVALAGEPSAARADCDGPYPSFREAAPFAREIVIGDVVAVEGSEWIASEGRTTRFLLRAWSLDGKGPVALTIRDMMSQPCAGQLFAGVGDRVAIAFDARAVANREPVNAIAWIGGRSPEVVGIETLTVAEVFRAVGLEAPAVFPPPEATVPESGFPWLPLGAVAAVALLAVAVSLRLLLPGDAA